MADKNVGKFLARFHESKDVDEVFTCGCCYWFAEILHLRFADSVIMYDPVINHFSTKIGEHIYDITGCVDGQYDMEPWHEFISDPLERQRVIENCIMF